MKKVELLSPAGNLEKLRFALHYGADAVYLGGEKFSLRQRAGNFTLNQLRLAKEMTKRSGARLYVAVNLFAHNKDIEELPDYLKSIRLLQVDGLIVSDPGVFLCTKEYAPDIPIILSTQANNCNWQTLQFWQKLGVKKVCLARELTLQEIREIRAKTSLDLEVFVHGSMCMAYSGRCLLSSYLTRRDSNRGDCAQPCRWKYRLLEEMQPENSLIIEEDASGTYLLSSKDLCMIEHIPELIEAGINSFKIEGRMRSVYYVSVATWIYRQAIETYYKNPDFYRLQQASWLEELRKVSHREYTTGFYFDNQPDQSYQSQPGNYQIIGFVTENPPGNKAGIGVKNRVRRGDLVEIFRKPFNVEQARVLALWNSDQEPVDTLHPGVNGFLKTDESLQKFDLIRKKMVAD